MHLMKTIFVVYILYVASLFEGCAYHGDVLIYSPGGDVDRATEVDSNVGLK